MKRGFPAFTDVLVVGAGVIGCATAYFLARMGAKVAVVDRGGVGSGASFHATGLLGGVTNDLLSEAAFSLNLEIIPRLQEETGINTLFQTQEGLHLALTDQQAELARTMAAVPGVAGTTRAFVDGDEARKFDPRLSPLILGALWVSKVAQVDSYRYTLALAQGAEHGSAKFLTRRVIGLVRQKSKVTGVMTESGIIEADRVVLANGAWSGECGEWLGMSVPVHPQKGQSIRLRWSGDPLRYLIRQFGWGHLIQRTDGFLSAGSTAEDDQGMDTIPTFEARIKVMERALSLMPCLETAEVVTQFAGPRPQSVDNLPIMGPVPTLSGVYLNTGHGGSGVSWAAASGLHVAELVINGVSAVLPEAPYLPSRFDSKQAQS